jgi:hypothetical protein
VIDLPKPFVEAQRVVLPLATFMWWYLAFVNIYHVSRIECCKKTKSTNTKKSPMQKHKSIRKIRKN